MLAITQDNVTQANAAYDCIVAAVVNDNPVEGIADYGHTIGRKPDQLLRMMFPSAASDVT